MKKLYISTKKPINSLEDLIESLYTTRSGKRKWGANPTYTDKGCSKVECYADRRSFEDLLTLARTYFPETTDLELLKVMYKLELGFIYCPDIRKLVFIGEQGWPINEISFNHMIEQHYPYVAGTPKAETLKELYNQI